ARTSRRLGKRSASAPAKNDSTSIGANCSALTRPRRNAEFVSSRTSHACATDCIHVPTSETSCPEKKRRKSRGRDARRAAGSRESDGTHSVYRLGASDGPRRVNARGGPAKPRDSSISEHALQGEHVEPASELERDLVLVADADEAAALVQPQ